MLLLADHRTDVGKKREATKVWVENGVVMQRLASHEFGGHDDEKRHPNVLICWFVCVLAMITNITQAIIIKASKRRNVPLSKILWDMGRDPNHSSSLFADRFSRFNRKVKYGAAGWQALDVFYNFYEKTEPQLKNDLEGYLTRYWIENTRSLQGIINRYKIVVNLLVDSFRKFKNEPEIRLVSIASGSAQAVIAAMLRCPNLNIRVKLIDIDAAAIKEAERLVKEAGLAERFTFIRGTSSNFESACEDFCPHIVEMVGFLDYRPKKQAENLIRRIRNCLSEDGIFLTCNIKHNPEKIILDWILLWPMIYRSEYEFANILVNSGFAPERIKIYYEPMQIHGIGVCQK